MTENALLSVRDVSLQERGIVALSPITFDLLPGFKLAIAGESGAGKSTLLQLIAGLIEPTTGQIWVDGVRGRGPAVALVAGYPGVAYLSQKSDLPKFLRVEQVLRYAGQLSKVDLPRLISLCRIGHLLPQRTDQLSGGEQQRIALALLLLKGPKLLLLDEPFSNLDRVHKQTMQAIIEEVSAQLNITCVLVSHDAADTLAWADEIIVLQRGRLVQRAKPEVIYREPATEYVAALFGDYNVVQGTDSDLLRPTASMGSALLIRPEQLRLGPPRPNSLAGLVRARRFMGSYYEVEVQLPGGTVVRARTGDAGFAVGEVIGVSVAGGS